MSLKKWLLATVLIGSSPAYAICGALCPAYGFYVMGNFGEASINYNKTLITQFLSVNPPSSTVISNTRNSYGAGLGLGYKLNDFFAAEAAYDYFWTSQQSNLTSNTLNINITQKNTRSAVLFARGILPITPLLGLYGKVGGDYSWTQLNMSGTGINSIQKTANKLKWAWGAGLEYQVARHFSAFLDWTRLIGQQSNAQPLNGPNPNVKVNIPNINFYSVGVRVFFG